MQSWHFGEDAFPPIDFAVRTLVRDGLRVSPFDHHADGDGTLRARGLDARLWQEWLASLIGLQSSITDTVQVDKMTADAQQRMRAMADVMMQPGSIVPGSLPLRERLNEMWDEYRGTYRPWEGPMQIDERGVRRLGSRDLRRLWQDLAKLHDRLPPLSVFLVEYSVPVVMAMPPRSCLIAPDPMPSGYALQIQSAARELVGLS